MVWIRQPMTQPQLNVLYSKMVTMFALDATYLKSGVGKLLTWPVDALGGAMVGFADKTADVHF